MSYDEEQHYCPNCGAILEDQPGFDPDDNYWICTECGQGLYGECEEDENTLYEGVLWCCDGCGAILNKQSGFSDYLSSWTCTECGYSNIIDEDEIYESEEEYQLQKNIESEEEADNNDEEDDDDYDEDYEYVNHADEADENIYIGSLIT